MKRKWCKLISFQLCSSETTSYPAPWRGKRSSANPCEQQCLQHSETCLQQCEGTPSTPWVLHLIRLSLPWYSSWTLIQTFSFSHLEHCKVTSDPVRSHSKSLGRLQASHVCFILTNTHTPRRQLRSRMCLNKCADTFWTTSDYKHAGGRSRIYNHPNALQKQLGWREARTVFPMEDSTECHSARHWKHREHEAAVCKVNASEQRYERGRDLTLRVQLAKPKSPSALRLQMEGGTWYGEANIQGTWRPKWSS